MCSHKFILNQAPSEFFKAIGIILLHKFLTAFLIIVQHDALQKSIGELQITHFLFAISANILNKLVVSVNRKLFFQTFSNSLTECFLALNFAFTKRSVKQFLVNSMLLIALNVGNLIAKVARVVAQLFFLYFQESSQLCIVFISLARIHRDDVALLRSIEKCLLCFVLNVIGHHRCSFNGQTTLFGVALLIELAQIAFQHVVVFIAINAFKAAQTRSEHVDLTVDQRIINRDGVMVNLVVAIEFDAEFGCHSNIKLERIRCRLFQILGLLTFVLQRFAKHLNFIVLHIFINLLTNELVNGIHLGRCTILLFNQSHRNHAWTETRIISLLTEVFQRFFNVLLIIGLFYGESQQTIHLVCNFK